MCAVVGQTLNIRRVSGASIPLNVSSSRITSGIWTDAFTIASNPVRATETRSPAVRSCASLMSRETASPSAISTSGASVETTRVGVATIVRTGAADRDRVCALRCTRRTRAKMLPNLPVDQSVIGSASRIPDNGFRSVECSEPR